MKLSFFLSYITESVLLTWLDKLTEHEKTIKPFALHREWREKEMKKEKVYEPPSTKTVFEE